MKRKEILTIILLICVLFSLQAVAAAGSDVNGTDSTALSVDNVSAYALPSSDTDTLAEVANADSFSQLQGIVDGVSTGEIELTRNYTYKGSDSGSDGVSISGKTITINGNGNVIIDADHKSRIFNIASDATVTLKGITFINGNSTGHGGSISSTGKLIIEDCKFINNTAVGHGGAVYLGSSDGDRITGSTFEGNVAGLNGGALDWYMGSSHGEVIKSTFNNNTAKRSGGAIHWSGHYGTIRDSNFTNNTAAGEIHSSIGEKFGGGDGGAVLWVGSNGTIDNCRFIDNEAVKNASFDESGRGGAIFLHGNYTENCTNTTIMNSIFEYNHAGLNGGAVDWQEGAHDGNIYNTTFRHNVADSNGGAVFWAGHHGEIHDTNFTNNTAKGLLTDMHGNTGDGGAIIWSGVNGTVVNSRFIDNTAAKRGGAVYLQNCTHDNCTNTTFRNCYFKNNTAGTNGGAIDWHTGAHDGLVDNATFINNTAKRSGGAIFWNGHNGTIQYSRFYDNKALGINNATDVHGNVTYGGDGGAVMWSGALGNVVYCNFVNNTAAKRGGAVFLQGSEAEDCDNTTFKHSYFRNNTAGTNGGAIDWNEGAHNGMVDNVTFINNTARRSGGAIFWFGMQGIVNNSEFTGNRALGETEAINSFGNLTYGGHGGAIMWTGSNGTIENSTFDKNTAKVNGGAIFLQGSEKYGDCFNVTVKDSEFTFNTAGVNGGAIDWYKGALKGTVITCSFENNIANRSGGAIFWFGRNGTIADSNFTGNSALGNTLYNDSYNTPTYGGNGGAIMWTGFQGSVTNCIFEENKASENGGAIYLQGSSEYGNCENTTFVDCTFESNVAGHDGGAIDWHRGARNGIVDNCDFINNTAKANGGAIHWNGLNGTVKNSRFDNNRATGEDWEYNMTITMEDVIIVNASSLPTDTPADSDIGKLYVLNYTNGTVRVFESYVAHNNGTALIWLKLDETTTTSSTISPMDWGIDHYFGGDGGTILWSGDFGLVDNCTFIDSNSARRGGGAYMTGSSNVTFSNCNFTNCTSGTNGGGVDWLAGARYGEIYNCTFINTRAARSAGAIYYDGWYGQMINITIINTTSYGGALKQSKDGLVKYAGWDSSHWDTNTTGGDAGAIMITGSHEYLYNITFINCTAAGRGGAVFLQDNTNVTFDLCTFENNRALGIANNTWNDDKNESSGRNILHTGNGGAIAFDVGATKGYIYHSQFINNTAARNGGAISFYAGSSGGHIYNSTFTNNTAHRSGGAFFWDGTNGTVSWCNFSGNRALGTALEYDMVLTYDNIVVVNNTLPEASASTMNKLYIVDNTTDKNHINYISYVTEKNGDSYTWLLLDETHIVNDTAPSATDWGMDQFFGGNGGTILWGGDVGTIDHCIIENSNSARRGGGAYMRGSNNITFSNSRFANDTSGTNGGALDWLAGANYGKVINCTFEDNRAARSAGTIYYDGDYGEFTNITIKDSYANGGALKTSADGKVKYAGWDSSHWDTNTTGGDAGAIMITGDNVSFYNVTFTNCTAVGRGGAVFLQDNANVTFDLCTFENNRALGTANNTWNDDKNTSSGRNDWNTGHGGAIGFDTGATNGTIRNSKFINNTAARDGGAISFAFGSANGTIYNSTFVNNTAKRNGGAFAWNGDNGNISYCNFTSNSALGTALDTDHVILTSLSQVKNTNRLPKESANTMNKLYVLVTTDNKGNNIKYELYVTIYNDDTNEYRWLKHTETYDTDPSPTDWAIDQYYGGDGGSIVWGGDTGLIDNCIFIDSNSARRGGGAYMLGSDHVTVSNSYFENSTSGTNGGGLDWLAGANYGKVINCTFNNTRAARSAGAIYYDGDYGEMINITIINATAFGGALDNSSDGKVKYAGWDSSHWDTNTTGGDAGAIMFTGDNIYVYNATFINCTAAGRGGAVFLQDNDNVTFELCTFEENSALGIANNTWKNYREERNDADPDTQVDYTLTGHGGAIAFDVGASDGYIINSVFNDNHARRDGGAIHYAAGASKGIVINSTFTNHSVNYDGGAIYLNGTDCEIHNSTFINNSAKDDGGAIFWQGNHGLIYNITCDLNHGTGTGENGTSSTKGGVICLTGSDISVEKSTFTNSFGGLLGGTIFVTGNEVNITDSVFINSTIGLEDGGALYILGNDTLIKNCTFDNCTAPHEGGTIYVLGNRVIIDNSTITNSSAVNGGAIYVEGNDVSISATISESFATGIPSMPVAVDSDYYEEKINDILGQIDEMIAHLSGISTENITSENITALNNTLHDLRSAVENILTADGKVNSTNLTAALGLLNALNDTLKQINATVSQAEYKNITINLFGDVNDIKKALDVIASVDDSLKVPEAIISQTDAMISSLDTLESQGVSAQNITDLNNALQAIRNAAEGILDGGKFNSTNIDLALSLLKDLNETLTEINATLSNNALDELFEYANETITKLNDLSKVVKSYAYSAEVYGCGGAIYIEGNGALINDSSITHTSAYYGGGIYISGRDATIDNSEFYTINATEDGGVLYITGDGGNLYNSNFTDNTAGDDGGAIYWTGDYGTIVNIDCTNNHGLCFNESSSRGGAICLVGSEVTISKSRFAYNNVTHKEGSDFEKIDGGALFITGNNVTISDTVFDHNNASHYGGTLYILGNETVIDNCTIDTSNATRGGAIYVEGENATIFAKFKNTNASLSGGAIYVRGENATIMNSTFDTTYAFGSSNNGGGAIMVNGNYTSIVNSNFTNNHADNNHEARGGAIYIKGKGTNVTDSKFEHSRSNLYGGAIYINGTNTTVKGSEFNDCRVSTDVSQGGAIYVLGENATIEDSSFIDSYAKLNGGAIYINGNDTTVRNSSFTGSIVDEDGSQGGSIYVNGTRAVIEGSDFVDSYAKLNGGSIYINGNETTVRDSNFTRSKVDVTGSEGGSIYVFGENATIEGSGFVDSYANLHGGSIYIKGNDTTVRDSNFTGSKVDVTGSEGGSIYVFGENAIIEGSGFVDSYAKLNGGSIYIKGNRTIVNGSVFTRSKVNQDGSCGGAIYLGGQNTTVTLCSFNDSYAEENGGAMYSTGSYSNVTYSNFTNNLADGNGGAIFWYGTKSTNNTVDGCIFTNNTAKGKTDINTKGGGAIYWSECGYYGKVINSYFYYNSVQSADNKADGGAILWDQSYHALVDKCTFVGDYVTSKAANIWVQGGAMYLRSRGNYTVSNCLFENCSSSKEAGALYIQSGTNGNGLPNVLTNIASVRVVNTTFKNNYVLADGGNNYCKGGGAVQVKQYKNIIFRNVTFINNTANKGGALTTAFNSASSEGDFEMYECKFINNTATGDGGAIYADVPKLNLHDSLFINNTAAGNGGGLYLSSRFNSFTTSYLNFTGNKAFKGSAIYANNALTLKHSVLLKNRANTSFFNAPTNVNDVITIDFKGWDNYLNGIYMADGSKSLTVRNVTYWNENGVVNTGETSEYDISPKHPAAATLESGQNFTIEIGDAYGVQLNKGQDTFLTDANGHISVSLASLLPAGASMDDIKYIDIYLTNEDYYTYVENSTRSYPDFTASTTNATFHLNGTVSMELPDNALSNVSVYIYDQFMGNITLEQGKGTINVSTLVNGNYLEVGSHPVVLKYAGDGNYRPFETTAMLNVTKAESRILFNVTTRYYDFIINVTVEHNDTGIITNPNDVTGNVTLNVRGQIINVELVNGTGSAIAYNMPPGAIKIEAAYSGDDNYKSSSNFTYENITERIRTLVEIKVNAHDIMVNETIYVNVTVISNQTVEGNITIILDNVEYNVTLKNSTGYFNKTGLTAGEKIITAIFAGNETLAPSSSYAHFEVHKYDAFVLIDARNITHGSDEVITISVPSDVEQGTINVTINGTKFPYKHILEVINGTVEIDLSNLDVDVYNITAYFESPKYKFTTNSSVFKVSKLKPPINIQVDNVTYGNDTVIMVEVVGAAGGNVTLRINDTLHVFENVSLVNDIATFAVKLPTGNYTIDVEYSGDESDDSNTAQSKFSVYKADPEIDIRLKDIVYGDDEHVDIYLNAAGNVTIKVDSVVVVDNVALDSDNHTEITIINPRTGKHTVEVIYAGNDNFNSANRISEFNVESMDTILVIDAAHIHVWDTAHIEVTVLDSREWTIPTAPGNVTLYINGVNYTAKVVNSIASFHIDNLTVGHKTVWAFYDGDGDLNPSRVMDSFNVYQRTPNVNVTADNITTAETGKITIHVPSNATGYVIVTGNFTGYQIRVDSFNQGIAEIPVANLVNDTYSVHIRYYGEADDNYTIAESDTTFKVTKADAQDIAVTAENIVYGQKANITVTVPDGLTGTITLKLNDPAQSEITLPIAGNKVSWIVENLAVGNYTVNATYNGNAKYNINSAGKSFNVTMVNSLITIDTPDVVDADTNATIIVRINETATGNITITVNGTKYNATIENGVAIFTINKLLAGQYNITAEYAGDGNNTPASLTLVNALTITKVSCYQINVSANDTKVDVNTTIVVKVPADATGNVSIYVDDEFVGNATVSQGIAKWNITRPYGNHTVNVTFTDGKYGPRYAVCDFWVFKHESPLVIDADAILVGDVAYVNVTAPSDNVTIEINGKSYNRVRYENGIAYFEVSGLEHGNKTVVAVYGGSDKYVINATTANFTANKRASQVNVTASGNSVGGNATVTVQLQRNATGYVTVNVNGTNYTVKLNSTGAGSINITGLGNGTYSVIATYLGDDQYESCSNDTQTFEMTKLNTAMVIDVADISYGGVARINVTMTPDDAAGFITIRIKDGQSITLPVVDGMVEWNVSGLAAGTYTVYANYSGNGKYNINNTEKVNKSFTVSQITPEISVVEVISEAGRNATVIVRIDSRTTENITVTVNGKPYSIKPDEYGIAVVVTDVLENGTFTAAADYAGDTNFTSGHDSLQFTANKTYDYEMNITAVDINVGDDINVTVNVPADAKGIVKLYVNGTNYTATVKDGKAVFNNTINLAEGRYNITAYFGNGKYENKTASGAFYVSMLETPITINVDDIRVGDRAKITVTVPAGVSENVTIEIDGVKYNRTASSGVAEFEVQMLTNGTRTVVATYYGDGKYAFNSTTANFTVSKRQSYVNVDVSDIDVGDVEYINVTVPDNATGFVVVNVGGVNYTVNMTNGVGTLPLAKLANGTYIVVATYLGDEQYATSANDTQTFTVSKVASQINMTISHDGIIANGTDVNITIRAPADATGKVNITVHDDVRHVTYFIYVNDGVGVLHLESPQIGIYNVTATYLGDGKYLSSKNETEFEVYITGMALSVETEPVTVTEHEGIKVWASGNHVGDEVKIIVTDSEGNVWLDRNVTFDEFHNTNLNMTSAELHLDLLPAGDYTVDAFYLEVNGTKVIEHTGTNHFTVSKLPSAIAIREIENITVGGSVTIELEMDPQAATGNISVFVNGVEHKLNTSQMTLTISDLPAEDYHVQAVYFGNHDYYESNATAAFRVSRNAAPIAINVTNSKVDGIEQINVTLPGDATGRVLIDIGDHHYYANVTDGVAAFNITKLDAARYNVTATYEGDGKYFSNITNSSFTVSKYQPEFSLSASNITVGEGEFITFETQYNVTGIVKVEINDKNYTSFVNEGKGNLTVYGLEAGDYNVTVYFEGDYKYLSAESPKESFTVNQTSGEIIIVAQNITYGETETVIIYIDAEGTVNVTVDTFEKLDVPIVDGKVVIEVPGYIAAGNYTVHVDYSGNVNVTNASAEVNFTVAKKDPAMNVEVQNITYGDVEHIRITVDAAGNVTVRVNGNETTIVLENGVEVTGLLRAIFAQMDSFDGRARVDVSGLEVGEYPVEVTFNGNENYNSATVRTSFFVTADNVTMSVEVANIRTDGSETINVTFSNTNVTGEVIINVDGVNYTRSIENGKANLTLDKLSNSTHSVVVIYEGDRNFNGTWASDTFNVSRVKPAISVDVSDRTVGQAERIVVNLPDNATGYVVIDVDGTKYHVDIVEGQDIALELDKLENKTYDVNVYYSGDGFWQSADASGTFNVSKTKADVAVTADNITLGEAAVINITVTPGATGNVTVTIGDEFNRTVGITDGVVTVAVPGLAVGDKTVVVTYNGDGKYLPNSSTTTFSVAKLNSTSNIEIVDNGNGTVTVIVPQNATGNVTIYVDGKNFTVNVTDGIGVVTLENVTPGKHDLTAVYSGDENHTNATAYGTVVIPKLASPVSVAVHDIYVGDAAYINVTAPTGDVTIEINGKTYAPTIFENGVARFAVENLAYGNKTVAVIYAGNSNYTENFTTANFTVGKRDSFVKVNVSDINVGDVEIINVTVPGNATGLVVVDINGTNYTVNVTGGVGLLPIAKLGNGTYRVIATYLGDAQYLPEVNNTLTFNVDKVPSQINVTVSHEGIVANGTDVNITVQAPVDATGKVNITLSDGIKNITYIIYVNDGVGVLHLESPEIGIYNVTVRYLGDGKYIGSENETEFDVYPTGKELAVDTESITVAEQETILVYVLGNHIGDEVEIIVRDYEGNTVDVQNATFSSYISIINATSARLTLDKLPAGDYSVEALYIEVNGSKRIEHTGTGSFTVSKLPSTIKIKEIRNITVGESVTVELEFEPSEATGNISVFVNGVEHVLNTTSLTLTLSDLPAEEYLVHAVYYGDHNYDGSNASSAFKVSKINLVIGVNATSVNVGEDVLIEITAPDDIQNPILVDVAGTGYYVNMTGGKGKLYVPNLASGEYNVTVRYLGDDNYTPANNTAGFKVSKVPSTVNVTAADITVGDKAVINVETPKDLCGNVTVSVDGNDYTVFVSGGVGTLVVPDLEAGPHTVNVTFDGCKKYEPSNSSTTFNVDKINATAAIRVVDQGNGTVVVVVGDNATGNVTINVDGKNYTASVVNGTAVVDLGNVTPGEHSVEVIYSGDDTHANATVNAVVTAPKYDTSMEVDVPEAKEGETTYITVRVPENATGNVTVTIDGQTRTVEVHDGTAVVPVDNLTSGSKSVIVEYSGDDNYASNYTVFSFDVEKAKVVPDVKVVDNGNGTVVVVVGDNATGNVTIKVGNDTYTASVVNGTAVVELGNVTPGEHSVEVIYSGDDTHANATVYATVTAPKYGTSMEVDVPEAKEGETTYITVRVPENATGNVTVTIDGQTRTVEVHDGTAVVPVDNLTPGSKSVIVEYSGDDNYASNYTVFSFDVEKAKVSPEIYVVDQGNGTVVVIVSDNATGNVTVKVGNDTVTVPVVNGTAVITLDNLTPGENTVEIIYSGDDTHSNATFAATVTGSRYDSPISVSAETAYVGDKAAITVNLPENATGNVTIEVDGVKYTSEVKGGKARFEIANLTDGTKTVAVEYSGDDSYNANHTAAAITVSKRPSWVSAEIEDIKVGENVTVTVHVPEDATGQVLIDIDGVGYYVNVTGGVGTAQIPRMPNGIYDVNLTYVGDDKYLPSGNYSQFDVNKIPSYVIPKAENILVGDNEVILFEVPADATGNLTVIINGEEFTFNLDEILAASGYEEGIYSVAVSDGQGVLVISGLPKGVYNVTVTYNGNYKYLKSTNSTTFTVSEKDSDMTVVDCGNGTVKVYVSDNATGNVTVKVGNETYTGEVIDGVAVISLDNLTAGDHDIEVIYSGDSNHAPKTVDSKVSIPKKPASISVSAHDIYVGDTEHIVVTVPEDATGTVSIEINGVQYNATAENGKATFDVEGLASGNKTVAVTYWGDGKYDRNFTTGQFEVKKVPSTLKATSMDIKVGKDEKIKISFPEDATGRVIVTVDGTDYSGTIVNGKVNVNIPNLPAGKYTAKVKYEGDDKYLPCTNTTKFEVVKSDSPISASGDYIEVGDDGTVTVNLPSDATGTVTITVDGKKYKSKVVNGKAVFKIPGLTEGVHDVEVYYSGDDKYDANTTATEIVVDNSNPNPHRNGSHGFEAEKGIALSAYETGNPIFALLIILLAVGTAQLRRFKK